MNKIRSLGPLLLPFTYIFLGLLILFLFRLGLLITHFDRVIDTPGFLALFVVGARMDVILLSYFIVIPTIILFLSPAWLRPHTNRFIAGWSALSISVIAYMEVATFPFIEEFDVRPDQKFLEYLGSVNEVGNTLIKAYPVEMIIGVVILILAAYSVWKLTSVYLTQQYHWSWLVRIVALPLVIALLFLGARSTLGHRPANLSTASFSNNNFANQLALNSTYTMLYAGYSMLRHEKNPSIDYGKMDPLEIFSRVQAQNRFNTLTDNQDIPFLRFQDSPAALERPMNIVIFLQESVGASDVGCLEGPPVTPNLCRLKDEGLWFSNLYATGTRTARGIEATVSGFLPTSAVGVIKLSKARKNFFSLASLLQRHGYSTDFIYGGMANFDEMKTFFLGNGFENIYEQPHYKNPAFLGTWGVSDEDLVRKANEVFKAHGDKPFFSLLLSTSNHSPYEFPDGRIELYEQPKQTHLNAVKYADYAIGLFFDLARKEEYFKNTLFLVVADHNSHVRGNDYVPISKFQIPGLLIGPNVPKTSFDKVASQIDLAPTLLGFSGLDTTHPMIGRDLMQLPANIPGRAMMQSGVNNAYMVGNDVTILRPFLPSEQFTYDPKTDKLTDVPDNLEMAKDALAHAHLPWVLYSGEDYRLPSDSEDEVTN